MVRKASIVSMPEHISETTLRKGTQELATKDARAHWRKMVKKDRKGAVTRFLEEKTRTRSVENADTGGIHNIIEDVIRSKTFEMVMLGLICLQAASIGWQVQYNAVYHEKLWVHDLIELVFCIGFTLELIVRISVLQWNFCLRDVTWNIFDAFCVTLMNADIIVERVWGSNVSVLTQVPSLRVVRVIRIVRVLRVIRVLKFFRELRLMLHSILGSAKSLIWAVSVLGVMFYTFGISLTQGAVDFCRQTAHRCDALDQEIVDLQQHFGSLWSSMLSLFYSMSGGISWADLVDSLRPLHWSYTAVLLSYICCTSIAVVNIVTGVFVESAMQSSQKDKESLIEEELTNKQCYVESMQQIFMAMDKDGNGGIGLEEFETAIVDPRMVAYFNALGLDITDVETLFTLLDRDSTGTIDMEEFLVGCMRLKGEASSLNLAKMSLESEWIVHAMGNLTDAMRELLAVVNPSAPLLEVQRLPCQPAPERDVTADC